VRARVCVFVGIFGSTVLRDFRENRNLMTFDFSCI